VLLALLANSMKRFVHNVVNLRRFLLFHVKIVLYIVAIVFNPCVPLSPAVTKAVGIVAIMIVTVAAVAAMTVGIAESVTIAGNTDVTLHSTLTVVCA
jgi:hypothetical protein